MKSPTNGKFVKNGKHRTSAVKPRRVLTLNEQCAPAMDGKSVKVILFDLDNTLIETSRAGGVAMQKTSELLKTTLALDDMTISSICDKFKQKLLHESFDPSAGRSIDEVRVHHWEESIQETMGSCSSQTLAAQCYYMWKNSRLEVLCLSPEICTLLKKLRSTYKLLLLTNGETQTQREKSGGGQM
ncbi:N-acylneuraminate-9-phosphatase [Collichthys lucidus]|uniref:N-acylneuraminate-9-phosphatase n=1 Tax=Collichthys lucidus TaxID=240159 RepID=A0A4U5VCI7_COLLU|nr:N-acylneuraminate-9-phosphatase [Collichthys lucidus]